MDKKSDPFNLGFLKYVAAAAVIYWAVQFLADDLVRASLHTSRNMAAFNAILIALIIDAAIAIAARFEFNEQGGGIFVYKSLADAIIVLALFLTASFGVGMDAGNSLSPLGIAYMVTHILAWAMFAISGMVVMTWLLRR